MERTKNIARFLRRIHKEANIDQTPVAYELEAHGVTPSSKLKHILETQRHVLDFVKVKWDEGKHLSIRPDAGKVVILIALSTGIVGSFSGFQFVRRRRDNNSEGKGIHSA